MVSAVLFFPDEEIFLLDTHIIDLTYKMAIFHNITGWMRVFGVRQISRIIQYSIHISSKKVASRFTSTGFSRSIRKSPGNLSGVEATINGVRCRFENASLSIDFLSPDMARISWEPGDLPIPYAIVKQDWAKVHLALEEAEGIWRLTSSLIQIQIGRDGSLKFLSATNQVLRQESPPLMIIERKKLGWLTRQKLRPEECLYGLGEQSGPLNLRGTSHRMWNIDPRGGYGPGVDPLYMPLPVYMSLHSLGSYLVFYENSFPAIFDFSPNIENGQDSSEIIFAGGVLRYYCIVGHPSDILRRFTQLTGRPGLPPKWSLGYHHSRWGINNGKEIHAIAAGFASHDLPLSAIHLDIDHQQGYRTLTVDETRFPDLAALANELDRQGIKLVTIVNPSVKIEAEFPLYQEGLRDNRFLIDNKGKPVKGVVWAGWSVFPDFTDPKTRTWWKGQYNGLIDSNVAGFWHDMNEPTSFTLVSDMDLPPDTTYMLEGNGGDHSQAHNLYALLMNQAGYEALSERRSSGRPWLLSRSGWVSQQRYAWNWTGDVETSWDALRMTVATILGLGLSGIAYSGPDIGGFSGNPSPELYLRWFQMAAFLPLFRTHSPITTAQRHPWSFGEPFTGIIRKYLKFRYQLMPYLYSLAFQASQTGLPLVRPLFWLDIQDRNLWELDDAFMLGDSLLVAPVLSPNATTRRIYLPRGKWFSWWDETEYQGPGTVELKVSLENIPILVRSGSLVPQEEAGHLTLHGYPPDLDEPSTPLILYSDSGDGYGISRLDRFHLEGKPDRLTLTRIGEGEFPFLYNKIYLRIHHFKVRKCTVDDQEIKPKGQFIQTKLFDRIILEK